MSFKLMLARWRSESASQPIRERSRSINLKINHSNNWLIPLPEYSVQFAMNSFAKIIVMQIKNVFIAYPNFSAQPHPWTIIVVMVWPLVWISSRISISQKFENISSDLTKNSENFRSDSHHFFLYFCVYISLNKGDLSKFCLKFSVLVTSCRWQYFG